MRSLDIISEKSLGHYLGMSVHNKLAKILAPAKPPTDRRQSPTGPPTRARDRDTKQHPQNLDV
jgi:hypothetical protein